MASGGGMVKVASIQFAATKNAPEASRQKAARMINEAADKGARLLVLPELWPTGFTPENFPAQAETMREASITMLRKLARTRQIFIVGGSVAEKRDGRLYNTVAVIEETGEIAVKYRKAHLCRQEENIFSPGDEWALAEYAGLRLGIANNYDIYFPEFVRNLALRSAQLFAVPLLIKENMAKAQLLAQARALENNCFVILANQAKPQAAGQSCIIAPDGCILAAAESGEEVLLSELDIGTLALAHRDHNDLNRRRNILDEIDNSQL